jgi:DNA repair protein RadC
MRIARKKRRSSYKRTQGTCIVCQQPNITKPLHSVHDILACFRPFRDKSQEYLVTLSLDSGGKLLRRRVVTIGTLTSNLVHPREVFAGPLKDGAASVIIAHNHPSGAVEPSEADVAATQQLISVGIMLGIRVRDHYIVTRDGHFSFLEQGLIKPI